MHNTSKLLLNHALCHLMIIPACIYGELWMVVASFVWWQIIATVSISGGYHRYYSHKSFETYSWYQFVVNVLGIFAGAGPVLTWVGSHRMHHAYADTEKDPHSYTYKGILVIYFNTWGYTAIINKKFLKGLISDPVVKWFYKNYFKINLTIIIVLLLIDPLFLIFGYAMPVVFAFHGYSILNILGHRGATPQNTWIGNILTAGEGWHANHHANCNDYRIGKVWWQWDPASVFIKLIKINR